MTLKVKIDRVVEEKRQRMNVGRNGVGDVTIMKEETEYNLEKASSISRAYWISD